VDAITPVCDIYPSLVSMHLLLLGEKNKRVIAPKSFATILVLRARAG